MARYQDWSGNGIAPGRVVVIGDTPLDIDCAHACGCVSVAVGSGQVYGLEELASHRPDLLLPGLCDTGSLVDWLRAIAAS